MVTLKGKDIKKMNTKEIESKLKEMKFELLKARAGATKGGTSKVREVKKIIARLYTFNHQNKTGELKQK
jgi:ribosomal protein L29